MKKQALIVVLLSLVLVLPAMADSSRNQVQRRADSYVQQLRDKGWTVAPDWYWDDLDEDQVLQVDRTLYDGLQYVFVAFGDDDAQDVDLYVYDEDWNLISRDNDSSSTAVVKVTPAWTGESTFGRGSILPERAGARSHSSSGITNTEKRIV